METTEDIINKIREMMGEESKKIKELERAREQWKDRGEIEKEADAKRKMLLHFGAWFALMDLEEFADAD